MTARQRHDHLMGTLRSAAAGVQPTVSTDIDAVRSAARFLWDEGSGGTAGLSWEQRLAKKYHERLFREYALADVSRYKEGAVGLRWRTEAEVFDGKGQFVCGNKQCMEDDGLASFELNFAWVEHGEPKQALVKLRVCPSCAEKLHYKQRKAARREARREAKQEAKQAKRRRREEQKRQKRKKGPAAMGDGGSRGDESDSESSGAAGAATADAAADAGADASEGGVRRHRQVEAGSDEPRATTEPGPAEARTGATFDDQFEAYCKGMLV